MKAHENSMGVVWRCTESQTMGMLLAPTKVPWGGTWSASLL